ncbi:hypothetical protein DMO17_07230 [Aquipseudomonas alcaligenes]|uniref:Uncharacterized protein n=1 Tax=Aquipseudomonas alcaligenes TaxID=43263 RepID=A0A2V4LN78_AQUAC|nr:hypothetical protein [Pseudomonas alcaligenes]PYC27523.1 hypothetical protein DMO17_07230 [Pseudomonas alcaligenes]
MSGIRRAILLGLLLSCAPVLAKDWPAGVKQTFRDSCVNSAGEPLGKERALLYCDCTVGRIDRDFSLAEMAALEQAELPPTLIERLQQVSQQCLGELGAQR